MTDARRFVTVEDYEPVARGLLAPATYGYYAGGAGDERSIEGNRRALERLQLRPRVLRGVGRPDTSTEILGHTVAAPVLIAPWALQRLAHPDGEVATATAAAAARTIMVVSGTVLDRIDEITATGAALWWQTYLFTDRGVTADLLHRAVAAGCHAIVWTVDVPVFGLRHRDVRLDAVSPAGAPGSGLDLDPSLTWEDLAWIRDQAPETPIVVKGILRGDDARLAVDHGADAVIVSNHGGRQLDGAVAGIDALPEVVQEVAGAVPVLVDGGLRSGTDVVKALALGAAATLVARPTAWGLAVAGQQGVEDVLRILREETANVMAQCGCRTVAEIDRDLVRPAP